MNDVVTNAHKAPPLPVEVAQGLVAELENIQGQQSKLKEREAVIKDMLRGLGMGKHDVGDHTVSVSPNRRLDEAKVLAAYPPEKYSWLYKQVVKSDAVKAYVAPLEYSEQLSSDVGAPKVLLRENK